MSSFSRGTMPANFEDFRSSVSRSLRLPTPEPQYWFAKAAMAGRISLAALNAGMPTVQQFLSMAGNGAVLPPDLDQLVRTSDMYPDIIQSIDDFEQGEGDTIKFQRDVYDGGGYSELERRFNADVPIATTGQSVRVEEVPVVLMEYTGPGAASGQVIPYAIKSFDAKFRAAKESLASKASRNLARDYMKWIDVVIRDLFRATTNITYSDAAAGVTSVSALTAGAGHIANLEMLLAAKKSISDREWKKFPNGRYLALVPTKFNTDMVGDPDYRDLSKQHADGRNQLFGYIGSVQDMDIFEVSTLKTYAPAAAVPGDASVVPAGTTVQEGLVIGPGAVGFGTALPPECRFLDDTNGGTLAKVFWYAIHAFKTLDNRGIQRMLWQ